MNHPKTANGANSGANKDTRRRAAMTYFALRQGVTVAAVDVRGTGTVDFNIETMAMTFNLVNGMKKSLSSNPLLSFILEGDEDDSAMDTAP